jgi:hypothetical protein
MRQEVRGVYLVSSDTKVIQVWCKGSREVPPGSGIWEDFNYSDELSPLDVLEGGAGQGLDWSAMVALMIAKVQNKLPELVAMKEGVLLKETEE